MVTRRLVAVLLAVLTLLGLGLGLGGGAEGALASTGDSTSSSRTALPDAVTDHVVVVGVPGLRWDDVATGVMPHLSGLAADHAVGSLSIRTGWSVTCPVDGWLTVGAGNRARGDAHPRGPGGAFCPTVRSIDLPLVDADGGALVETVPRYVAANDRLDFGADVGTLGEVLADAGACTTAVGPGAALAVADPTGAVDVYRPTLPGTEAQTADLLARCPVTVVDLPSLIGISLPEGADPTGLADADQPVPADRRAALVQIDAALARIDQARPAGSTLLVVGVSEVGDDAPRLHVAVAAGLDPAGQPYGERWLTAASTRRAPFVQLFDVAPTVLALLGLDGPSAVVGQQLRPTSGRPSGLEATVAQLVDLDRAAQAQRRLVPRFFLILVVSQVVLYLAAYLALRTASGRRRRAVLEGLHRTALVFAAAPVSTYLANLLPWWRAELLLPSLLGVVALADLVIVAVALAGPWRRQTFGPAGAVSAITFGALAVDVLTGARLQLSSLAGYSPLVAGRFAGFGNVAYAVFAAAGLLTAAWVAGVLISRGRPRAAVTAAVGIGVLAIVLDGAPPWGSDFGGVLALVPAVAVLAMLLLGIRISVLRLVAIMALSVLVVSGFAVLDYLRPVEDRTHLGRFVGQVLDGSATTVVRRKAEANINLLKRSVLTLLVPIATLFVTVVLLRPLRSNAAGLARAFDRSPTLRHGLLATLVMSVVGFATNDSGIAIPALAMTLAVPVALACSARALALDATDDPGAGDEPLRHARTTEDADTAR